MWALAGSFPFLFVASSLAAAASSVQRLRWHSLIECPGFMQVLIGWPSSGEAGSFLKETCGDGPEHEGLGFGGGVDKRDYDDFPIGWNVVIAAMLDLVCISLARGHRIGRRGVLGGFLLPFYDTPYALGHKVSSGMGYPCHSWVMGP
ncbi:hypothetical protein BS47DRAFT_1364351 [Hydnum rufescens UP504]|uniref:Secreted protein n=1 Tax=Hydnum rufescens UP504 TaxID=1448309 RepID=A0A9P6ASS8_9AGAM|nr:hypothetical protein BS47DRAFT_1364351 [Hydnum rufescens UP504]